MNMDIPMHQTKYENSVYRYPKSRVFWNTFNGTDISIFCPQTKQEFDTFVRRQTSVVLVLFISWKYQNCINAYENIKPFVNGVNKLIIVDVDIIPSVAWKYQIQQLPTLLKIFQGHYVRQYQQEFNPSLLKKFIFSTTTWRGGSIR